MLYPCASGAVEAGAMTLLLRPRCNDPQPPSYAVICGDEVIGVHFQHPGASAWFSGVIKLMLARNSGPLPVTRATGRPRYGPTEASPAIRSSYRQSPRKPFKAILIATRRGTADLSQSP